jgi:hypothetical protein
MKPLLLLVLATVAISSLLVGLYIGYAINIVVAASLAIACGMYLIVGIFDMMPGSNFEKERV